jgi:hypothetical protein
VFREARYRIGMAIIWLSIASAVFGGIAWFLNHGMSYHP